MSKAIVVGDDWYVSLLFLRINEWNCPRSGSQSGPHDLSTANHPDRITALAFLDVPVHNPDDFCALVESVLEMAGCKHTVMMDVFEAEDVKTIPEDSAEVEQPVLFAACNQDAVRLLVHGCFAASPRGPVTTLDFDAS
ncbi:hypothetical protein BV25DRAFT_1917610 [Artomyces pyxidatus]|uniref:Uncharacterized protein n=1 Tax=Artomyces pyxidatus TaxID=48021 RepID=A0ACB8SX38_9AGAM|nr:hypothetical protein BV25DRAFT_1917610 [Artomyces pyxidatus]